MTEYEMILSDRYEDQFGELPDEMTVDFIIKPFAKRMEQGEDFRWREDKNQDGGWRGLRKV